jgi:hypothetical protein
MECVFKLEECVFKLEECVFKIEECILLESTRSLAFTQLNC